MVTYINANKLTNTLKNRGVFYIMPLEGVNSFESIPTYTPQETSLEKWLRAWDEQAEFLKSRGY